MRIELDIPTTTRRPDRLAWQIARMIHLQVGEATMSAQWDTGPHRVHDQTSRVKDWPEVK